MPCGYFDTTRKGNHSSFLTQQWLVGDAPFCLKFAFKVTHIPPKNGDFDRFSLFSNRGGSLNHKEIAKKVQLWRIGSRPWAFQQAIDEVRTLTLSPPKGGSKSDFFVFW